MTTNNKTLADVQPGGRVRLGDQAERARFEAFLRGNPLIALSAGTAWQVWQAALSAQPSPGATALGLPIVVDPTVPPDTFEVRQPSPGGQGDAPLRVFSAGRWTYDGTGQSFSHEDMDAAAFVVYRDAAVAARQPVYEGHTWVSDYVLAGLRERAEMPLQLRNGEVWHWQGDGHDFPESLACPVIMSAEALRALLAARQPVGEPVARLIEAVEGECDGLVISMETAAAILAHVSPAAYTPAAYMVDGRIEQGLFFDRAAAETMAAMNAGEVVPLFRSPALAVDLGEMPDGWRLSKKATCYQLSHGNDIIGNLVGPDAEENAAIIARVLDSQAVGNG